jgi:AhpD family alkylhydroperoxidase
MLLARDIQRYRARTGSDQDLLDKLRPYGHRLMREPSPLTPGEREFIAAFVSGVNSCRYGHGAHSLVARAFSVDEPLLAKSLDDVEIAPVDARLRPILRLMTLAVL